MMRKGTATASVIAVALWSAQAAATDDDDKRKSVIGIDGHLVGAVNRGTHEIGSGLEGRLGSHHTVKSGLIAARPEIGGGYNRVIGNDMGRVFGGVRLGVQFIVGAYLYGHLGYGWKAPSDGLTYDVGAAVDFLLLDLIRPGVHLDYMEIVDNMQTIRGGIHLDLAFR